MKLLNDSSHIDTFRCRLSRKLCRGEVDSSERKELDNPMYKGELSGREEVGFFNNSIIRNTHYLFQVSNDLGERI